MKIVIYQTNINPIGGVETVVYYLVKKYQDRDITVMYLEGSSEQLYRLSHYCKLKKFDYRPFTCERLFVNYGWDVIKDYATVTVQGYNVVHANYKYLNEHYKDNTHVPDNGFKTLAVSDWAGQNCGVPYEVNYNPVEIDDNRKPLLLVSATRLAPDKGKIVDRMTKLAKGLDDRNIPFLWVVFSNSNTVIQNKSVMSIPPRLDIIPYLRMADFVVQLSDSEACCMTVLESLSVKTPVIVTRIPSFIEQGVNDKNSLILDMDMSNLDDVLDHIQDRFNFTFTPKENHWDDLLVGDRKEELIPMKKLKVKATNAFQSSGGLICNELGYVPCEGEEFVITDDKLDFYCNGKNKRNVIYATIVEWED